MKQPTAREVMDKLLAHIEARTNAADNMVGWPVRNAQRARATELANELRSMADAIDRANIDDGK